MSDGTGSSVDAVIRAATSPYRKSLLKRLCPRVLAVSVAVTMILTSIGEAPADVARHAPIRIVSDTDFDDCACVKGGTGKINDPYLIGPWAINKVSGDAVFVDGTTLTKSFVLLNLTIAGNGSSSARGIVLRGINPGGVPTIRAAVYGAQTSIQSLGVGILVENSSYVTLDGAGENPNGAGIRSQGAGTINKNALGAIDVESSSNIAVRGWQLSANGVDVLAHARPVN